MQIDRRIRHEIEHGKYLVGRNYGEIWNWGTEVGKYRLARRVSMLCSELTSEMNILELGCGVGFVTREIMKTGAHITAIDISSDLLEIAKREVVDKNVEFKIENAYNLSFADGTFDAILGISVIHHLDVDRAIKEIFRTLKSGKKIHFIEPNMMNPQILLQKNIPVLKRLVGDSPDETAFFRWAFKKKLAKTGFKNISIYPFDFIHPQTPKYLIGAFSKIGAIFEHIPILKEISGSICITAEK